MGAAAEETNDTVLVKHFPGRISWVVGLYYLLRLHWHSYGERGGLPSEIGVMAGGCRCRRRRRHSGRSRQRQGINGSHWGRSEQWGAWSGAAHRYWIIARRQVVQ